MPWRSWSPCNWLVSKLRRTLGPGGGGAQFNPTVSPHDANRVLVSCDMTGAYITHDGGKSWRMFNLRGVVDFFVFDPLDATNERWEELRAHPDWHFWPPRPTDQPDALAENRARRPEADDEDAQQGQRNGGGGR